MRSFLTVFADFVQARISGAQPPTPENFTAFGPAYDPNDEMPSDDSAAAELLGEQVRLLYRDAAGEKSRRIVTLRKIRKSKGVIYLEGYCHLRKQSRRFRADRISEMIRIKSTGEIVENVETWLKEKLSPQPASPAAIVRDHSAEVAVLLYVAQCDEFYDAPERAIIVEYLADSSTATDSIDEAIDGAWPDDETFRFALQTLIQSPMPVREKLLKCAKRIVGSDGIIDATEARVIGLLKEALAA